MTWENVQFDCQADAAGPACVLRPDVFSLVATLNPSRAQPQIYEIKVSRADFLRDVSVPEKRHAYFRMAPQVFYAAPQGLLSREEIPPECGLVEQLGPGRWKVSRPAPRARAWPGFQQRHWLGLVLKPHKVPGSCPDAAPDL